MQSLPLAKDSMPAPPYRSVSEASGRIRRATAAHQGGAEMGVGR